MVLRAALGPVSSTTPVTPGELLAHMRQGAHGATATVSESDLADALNAAIGHVQGACGPILATDTRVAAWHDGRKGRIVLPGTPAISAVTELVAPDGVDVAGQVKAEHVDWSAAIITLPRMDAGEWVARVTTATSAERTGALRLAVLIIAAHQAGARLMPVGVPGPGFGVPRRAEDLMAGWRLAGVA